MLFGGVAGVTMKRDKIYLITDSIFSLLVDTMSTPHDYPL